MMTMIVRQVLVVAVTVLVWSGSVCEGLGTFGFDIHHRYSDPVKGTLSADGLPEKGTVPYYAAMVHRDRVVHHRRGLLSSSPSTTKPPLTFSYGNDTFLISSLGFLHYANVSVGSPELSFLVALDTGSDLFWLPCDCTSCVRELKTSSGGSFPLNIYSPNASKTSENVPCSSNLCSQKTKCTSATSDCPYIVEYLSANTSTSGILVEDNLHLITDNTAMKAIDAKITFGCGQIQTGSFLEDGAPNGLFGLGMTNISVPSTLARQGLISDSFSMCFGADGAGRISFGDKGSSDQKETPFALRQLHPTYNITVTQIIVGGNNANVVFNAIFDSGTSFTYLNDPAYSSITKSFNTAVKESRYIDTNGDLPFDYCYNIAPTQTELFIPTLELTMKGGDLFNVTDPILVIEMATKKYIYCLGVVKSEDINIIGQNFMTGHRIIFDRERNILGWKESNCYDNVQSSVLPESPPPSSSVSPSSSPASPSSSSAKPPATAKSPGATSGSKNTTQNVNTGAISPVAAKSYSTKLNPLTLTLLLLLVVLVPFFAVV